MYKIKQLMIFVFFLILLNCSEKISNSYDGPNFPSILTDTPIAITNIWYLLSLGHTNPIAHTLPTNHVYFWLKRDQENKPISTSVYAPGSGIVEKILIGNIVGGNVEVKIWVRMNKDFVYYFIHIVLDNHIVLGSTIKAGEKIGITGSASSIDLGAIDETVSLNFVNPLRYSNETLKCGKPFSYFQDSLKTQLYNLVDREGIDKDGKIDFDISGRLIGNWFFDGPIFYKDGSQEGWENEISFSYDNRRPNIALVNIGGVLGTWGKWDISGSKPDAKDVTISSGKVTYILIGKGLLIAQIIDDTHIKIELFLGIFSGTKEFDSNAHIFAR